MSETIANTNELPQEEIDQLTQHWDDLAEEMDWLEEQAEKAKEKGDEATLQKIGKYISQNQEWMQRILDKVAPDEEDEGTPITAEETTGPAEQAQSKRYVRRFENPDGTVVTIEADTEEELRDKIREQNEANREAFSRY
jgi:hypothetical protein